MAHLFLRDRDFEIESATIEASVGDPHWCDTYNRGRAKDLFWSIDVLARPRAFDGETWAPRVYFECLELPVKSWKDLAGMRKEWNDGYDDRTGEPNGCVYVFEHEEISRGSLIVGARRDARFELRWEGICNVHWDDEFGEGVPFRIETDATFAGISVAGSEKDTDASVLARLMTFIDVADLRQSPLEFLPSRYEDGVGMARARFHPVIHGG
jgi:hypothetical protein